VKPRTFRAAVFGVCLIVVNTVAQAQSIDVKSAPYTQAMLQAHYADADSLFAEIRDTRLHYKISGSGPVVLLVHGTYGDLKDWDVWAEILQREFTVVRLDLPGAGLTGAVPSGDYSIDEMHRLIDGLMARIGARRFAMAGVSFGGVVTFRYAATRPDMVSAVVLMNSAGVEYGRTQQINPDRENHFELPAASYQSFEDIRTSLSNTASSINVEAAKVLRTFAYLNRIDRHHERFAIVRAYDRGDPHAVLARIQQPVLIQWGGANRALSQATADEFVAGLTQAAATEKIVYPDIGHMPHLEIPERSAHDVMAFLRKHQARL